MTSLSLTTYFIILGFKSNLCPEDSGQKAIPKSFTVIHMHMISRVSSVPISIVALEQLCQQNVKLQC